MKYDIWAEGWRATGGHGPATLMAEGVEAVSFQQACDIAFAESDPDNEYYDSERLTYWACKLFDNEADARKAFG